VFYRIAGRAIHDGISTPPMVLMVVTAQRLAAVLGEGETREDARYQRASTIQQKR
jgi:hypothetical protein